MSRWTYPMRATEAVTTDVGTHDPPASSGASRLSRVRCVHCSMPAAGSQATCWSCGRDPRVPTDAGPPPAAAGAAGKAWRDALIVALATLLVLLVAIISVKANDDRSDRGVRGLAARVRGGTWSRATLGSASAQFPTAPARRTLPPAEGTEAPIDALVASASGVRAELRTVPLDGQVEAVDGPAMIEQLVEGYAASVHGTVGERQPAIVAGEPALDVAIDTPEGLVRVRATIVGTTGYLLAVAGPRQAFERFIGSFTAG